MDAGSLLCAGIKKARLMHPARSKLDTRISRALFRPPDALSRVTGSNELLTNFRYSLLPSPAAYFRSSSFIAFIWNCFG
jgi:hypothetical protein